MEDLLEQRLVEQLRQEAGQERKKPGPPAHEDRVRRDFTAQEPNRLWLTDITEHRTGEGKLYLCVVKDSWSNRIVAKAITNGSLRSL